MMKISSLTPGIQRDKMYISYYNYKKSIRVTKEITNFWHEGGASTHGNGWVQRLCVAPSIPNSNQRKHTNSRWLKLRARIQRLTDTDGDRTAEDGWRTQRQKSRGTEARMDGGKKNKKMVLKGYVHKQLDI